MSGTRLVLLAWAVMSFADGRRLGSYAHSTVALMTIGVLLLTLPVLLPARFPLEPPRPLDLSLALLAVVVLYPAATVVPANHADLPQGPLLLFLALVPCVVLLHLKARVPDLGAAVLMGGAAASGLFMIRHDPKPIIDVWYLTQGAADSVVHGFDMYLGHWPNSSGIKDGFPYLPGVGLVLAPFRLVGLDVRYGMLLACLLAALLVWRHAPKPYGPWLAVMLLAVPSWPTLVAYAWTEPILLLPLVLVFVLVRSGRPTAATVALLVAVATKQHVLLVLPVLAVWPALGWRRVLQASVGAGLITLPWLLVAPTHFLDGALYLNLHLKPRPDSLSLFTYAMEHGWQPPFALVGGLTLLAIVGATLVVRRHPAPPFVALACAWVLAVFHLANKQSFYNEWWLVITLLVVSLSCTELEREPALA